MPFSFVQKFCHLGTVWWKGKGVLLPLFITNSSNCRMWQKEMLHNFNLTFLQCGSSLCQNILLHSSVPLPLIWYYMELPMHVMFSVILDFFPWGLPFARFLTISYLHRLRAAGQPYLAYHPGLVRDTLAYHGCAELFQVCIDISLKWSYYCVTHFLHWFLLGEWHWKRRITIYCFFRTLSVVHISASLLSNDIHLKSDSWFMCIWIIVILCTDLFCYM